MRQRLLNRVFGLAALIAVGGCAGGSASAGSTAATSDPGAPPARLAIGRQWVTSKLGFMYSAAYFTRAQVADPRWEKARLDFMQTVESCEGGQRVVRRDVRWFPATPVSGEACAAVIYTVKCNTPIAADDDLEKNRNEMLYGELPSALEQACGEKNANRQPERDYNIVRYINDQTMLVDGDVCDRTAPTSDGPIVLTPTTRIATETRIDRAVAARFRDKGIVDSRFAEIPQRLSWSLRRANKISNIFPPDNVVSNDPSNIRITLTLGLNEAGRPYCVQLTARQAGRVWRRTIERTGPIDFKRFSLRPEYKTAPPRTRGDGSPADDAAALVDMFGTALGLPPVGAGK